MKRKLIPVIVGAVLLGILVPILVSRLSDDPTRAMQELKIAEVHIVIEDAYDTQRKTLRPGETSRVTKGGSIIAEIGVTRERASIWTEDDQYYLSFATGEVIWKGIVKGTKISVYLYHITLEEGLRNIRMIPREGLYNGNHWITLRWADKRQYVEVLLDFEPELRAGTAKSVDDIVDMLNTFYDRSGNRDTGILSALRKLILG